MLLLFVFFYFPTPTPLLRFSRSRSFYHSSSDSSLTTRFLVFFGFADGGAGEKTQAPGLSSTCLAARFCPFALGSGDASTGGAAGAFLGFGGALAFFAGAFFGLGAA